MNKALTLDQVREAGRSAFIGGGPLPDWWFVPPDDFVRVREGKYGRHVAFEDAPTDGWRHLPGCNCEFCEPHVMPIIRHLTLPGCGCEFCRS